MIDWNDLYGIPRWMTRMRWFLQTRSNWRAWWL
jgi:hypothetical protein